MQLLLLLLSLRLSTGMLATPPHPVHVSMTGSDDGDGTSAHPFATLSRAQTAVRARPVSDRHVLIGDGTYHLAATLALNSKDDGSVYEAIHAGRVVLSAGRPLPADAERVTEAAILAQLPPASRAATEASAGSGAGGDGSDDDVRSVRVVDLKASFGLTDYGQFSGRGSPNADAHLEMHTPMIAASGLELFWSPSSTSPAPTPSPASSNEMIRASYAAYPPNASGHNLIFSKMGAVDAHAPVGEPGFALDADAALASSQWAAQFDSPNPDVWGHGFWQWRWADAHYEAARLAVTNADPSASASVDHSGTEARSSVPAASSSQHEASVSLHFKVPVAPPGPRDCAKVVCCGDCQIAVASGSRGGGSEIFFLYNLLGELDEPNEVYLNRTSGKLYFIPPAPSPATPAWTGVVSVLEHVVDIRNASDVVLRGVALQHSRGIALNIRNTSAIQARNIRVEGAGSTGINVTSSSDCVLDTVTVRGTGDSGVVLDGGDRSTLTPARGVLRNSSISKTNYYVWSNAPVTFMGGVGNTITGSELFESTHQAVWVQGNDHLLEGNDVHDVMQQTEDSGAVYAGRDWTYVH
jgi:hypothetical protein